MAEAANEALPQEVRIAQDRNAKRQKGIAKAHGPAATAEPRAVMRSWLPVLTEGLARALAEKPDDDLRTFLGVVRELDHAKLGLCLLTGALERKENYLKAAEHIAHHIYWECFAAGFFKGYPKAAKKAEDQQKGQPLSLSQKRARTAAVLEGYKMEDWSPKLRVLAGNWGIDQLLRFLPDVFKVEKQIPRGKVKRERRPEKVLKLTPAARTYAQDSVAELISRNPVWLPMAEEPVKWMAWNKGVTSDKRLAGATNLVGYRHEATISAVRHSIRDGTMQPTLDAVNALQAVPFTINKRVLAVISACAAQKIAVKGVPNDDSRGHVMFELTVQTAKAMAGHERFWTPMNLDWRGRVYGLSSFNFQREDRARALFLFADGEPIGEDGLYWLKVHCANCGDFSGVSKKPFKERVRWAEENLDLITATAETPLRDLRWVEAEKPFLFLAACTELKDALVSGPSCITRLPVSFDGSCSGLQHMCAMVRSPEGALVNLTPNEQMQDVYQAVANRVRGRIEQDLTDKKKKHLARRCLDWIWEPSKPDRPRKTVKRNVMTYFYGSDVPGMTNQQLDGTMQELIEPLSGLEGIKTAEYVARHVKSTIKEVIEQPTEVMEFLRKLARALGHENLPLRWTTPCGFPWFNLYLEPETEQVRLFLHSLGIGFRIKSVTGEYAPNILISKAVNGASPNHACDAAHLLRTVNAAVSEGITSIATVHDSFGCLPSRASRFRKIIREEFVRMYQEHDVLQEIFDQAQADLSEPDTKRMPKGPPEWGPLDIRQVLKAEYAFA
jgi:DNA-directed RNA polymerase, mitochondrial